MTTAEIQNKVFAELDSRNLANPSIRKNALDHVLDFIKIVCLWECEDSYYFSYRYNAISSIDTALMSTLRQIMHYICNASNNHQQQTGL